MLAETKIYSDFIKRNKIIVKSDCFVYTLLGNQVTVDLWKDDDGRWFADAGDKCITKKASIYYYLTNRLNIVNGMIQ